MSDNASHPNEKKHFEPLVEITPTKKPEAPVAIIKVIGVGGGGGNAVSNMYRENVEGVRFLVCNTDAKALADSAVPNHVQLGPGLGAGGRLRRGARDGGRRTDTAGIESDDVIGALHTGHGGIHHPLNILHA